MSVKLYIGNTPVLSPFTGDTASFALNINNAISSSYVATASLLGDVPNSFFVKANGSVPAFATVNTMSMAVNTDLLVYVNNIPVSFVSGSTVTMPNLMLAGNDYGIYATTDGGLYAIYADTSSLPLGGYTPPTGYTTSNSRLIGGFYFAHSASSPLSILGRLRSDGGTTASASISMSLSTHGLVTGDYVDVILMTDLTYNTVNVQITASEATITFPSSGSTESYIADTAGKVYKINNKGAINRYSIWDLKFRPNCPDPRGMVLVNDSFWVDIWLTGRNYINVGTSRKGERIADGESTASYPLVSTKMGGTGTDTYGDCSWFTANEVVSHWGKKLLSYDDFCISAYNGTTENGSYGTDNQYTCRPPGLKYLSKWGMEQSYGVMSIWGSDLNFYLNASTTSTLTTVNAVSRSKASGVASITCSVAHNLQVGDVITTKLFTVGTYNRVNTTVLTAPSATSFTYNASGSDEVPKLDKAGRIYTGLSAATLTLPEYAYQAQTGGRGSIYTTADGLIAEIHGGFWGNSTNAGSRASLWNSYIWNSGNSFGVRGRCDHFVVP